MIDDREWFKKETWELTEEERKEHLGWFERKCYDWNLGEPGTVRFRRNMHFFSVLLCMTLGAIMVIVIIVTKPEVESYEMTYELVIKEDGTWDLHPRWKKK